MFKSKLILSEHGGHTYSIFEMIEAVTARKVIQSHTHGLIFTYIIMSLRLRDYFFFSL